MNPNSLTVTKKALCGKTTTIYNPGELLRIEFTYNKYKWLSNAKNNYDLKIFPPNDLPDTILSIGSNSTVFTLEEIEYFHYRINKHIQEEMIV